MDKSLNLMDLSFLICVKATDALPWWVIVRIRINIHKGSDT